MRAGRVCGWADVRSNYTMVAALISPAVRGYRLAVARFEKRRAERKTDGPWTLKPSLRIDRAVVRVEAIERREP